jgi:hypothetical protein
MGTTAPVSEPTATKYDVEGRLLEVCTCMSVCPCWIGNDPDGGTCESALAWRVDSGHIEGLDVSDLSLALSVHMPGNALAGGWKAAVFVDDRATDAQQDALLKLFTGQLGGAIADLAALIGEVVTVERVPITFTVAEGKGRLSVGEVADAEITGFTGATGKPTVMSETVFSTIPGSPVYVGKATSFTRKGSSHGMSDVLDLHERNAMQGHFRFAA